MKRYVNVIDCSVFIFTKHVVVQNSNELKPNKTRTLINFSKQYNQNKFMRSDVLIFVPIRIKINQTTFEDKSKLQFTARLTPSAYECTNPPNDIMTTVRVHSDYSILK